ncbi:MAG: PDZ domain-containing protein, partial [Planctomycetes bacterium]|nr:PDZ domain-containing protein [Planctomycetota bacterium]
MRRWLRPATTFVLLLALLAPLCVSQSAAPQPVKSFDDLAALQQRVRQISEKVRPAVVGIRMSSSSGSGCFISEDGWVATAGHVSGSKPGTKCRVVLYGGEMLDAEVFGWHEAMDYGLVKADTKGQKVPFCALGDSKKVVSGEWLIAMGHPLGPEPGRDAVVRAGRCLIPDNGRGMVVMDAPVISGDSGGPVFNLGGEIVAINQSIQTNNVFINNVTPVALYKELLAQFKEKKGFGNAGAPSWGKGMAPQAEGALTEAERKIYEQAVRALQEKNLKRSCELFEELLKAPKREGEVLYNAACAFSLYSAELKAKQAEEFADKAVTALKRASEAGWRDTTHASQDPDLNPIRERKDFKEWIEHTRKLSLKPVLGMTTRFAQGLRVDEVLPGSPAEKAGVQVGDIIERIGGQKIEKATQWAEWAIEKGLTPETEIKAKRAGKRVDLKLSVPSFGANVFGQGGARIVDLVEGGLAFNAGFKPGDVIIKVGDTKIEGVVDFANAMMLLPANEETLLEVKRGFARETIKFSYSTGDVGGDGKGALPRDDWKQGANLLKLWDAKLAGSAGVVFPVKRAGKQVAFATAVSADGYMLTKASEVDDGDKIELLDGANVFEANLVARDDRYDVALLKAKRSFSKFVTFTAPATAADVPPIGTLVASVDARGKAIAHGFVALPAYDTDKIVREPDPNGPFVGINAQDAAGGGAEVTTITPGMPGDKAGLKSGDVVLKFAGQAVADWTSLMAMIQSQKADATVEVEVRRGTETVKLQITLMPRAQALGQAAPSKGTGKPELGIFGVTAGKQGGGTIGAVRAGSPAELAGIQSGEILLKIDGKPVTQQKDV